MKNGCADISDVSTVSISSLPVANFDVVASGCPAKQDVTFTDQSVAADGIISKWIWDFGDSTDVVTKTDKSPIAHVYQVAGTYVAKLTMMNANGCAGLVKQKSCNDKRATGRLILFCRMPALPITFNLQTAAP
jgi:PKD repeat protein